MKDTLISEFVRKKRKSVKLTQIQLAKKSGVTYRFIRELESGKITVKVVTVNKVLKIFGAKLAPVKLKDLMNND